MFHSVQKRPRLIKHIKHVLLHCVNLGFLRGCKLPECLPLAVVDRDWLEGAAEDQDLDEECLSEGVIAELEIEQWKLRQVFRILVQNARVQFVHLQWLWIEVSHEVAKDWEDIV